MFDGLSNNINTETPSRRRTLGVIENNIQATPSKTRTPLKQSVEKDTLRRTQSLGTFDIKATPSIQRIIKSCTPGSRSSVRKLRFDDTPAFLRKDSLKARTSLDKGSVDEEETPWIPFATRVQRKPIGRSLSSIVKGLRDMQDEHLDEEMELVREMEGTEPAIPPRKSASAPTVLVEDSQIPEMRLGPDRAEASEDELAYEDEGDALLGKPAKSWRKKGQKRTTRRVDIRPNTAKWQPEPKWKGDESDSGEFEADAIPNSTKRDNEGLTSGAEAPEIAAAASDGEHEAPRRGRPSTSTTKDPLPKARRKISATAHANFRALKIKNRNSKGKGRGRFGRR